MGNQRTTKVMIMKRIEAIIRPERLNQVKAALEEIGVIGMTITEVRGRGEQKGLEFVSRAGKYRIDLLPKVMMECVVNDDEEEKVIETMVRAARTGEMGDGKIFVTDVDRCVRIRTGDKDDKAV